MKDKMIIPLLFHFMVSREPTNPSSMSSITARESLSATFTTTPTSSGTCPQLRSISDIVWSCLATVFACTWVSVHPNSPGKGEAQWKVVARRFELMVWSILVPELIIFWALRQWLGARHLARYYKAFGWTTTHGHFLQMGGFMLVDGDQDLEVLTHDRFRALLKEGTIRFPDISKEEIEALSKGDAFSKTIVVGQTLWFIAQCISRSAEGLVITEIELVTLAFAFLNGLMYFLWWNKPLDTSFVVRVPIYSTRSPVRLPLTSSTATFVFPYLSISIEEMSQSRAIHQVSDQPDRQDNSHDIDRVGEESYNEGPNAEITSRVEDVPGEIGQMSGDRRPSANLPVVNDDIFENLKIPKPELQRPDSAYSPEGMIPTMGQGFHSVPGPIFHAQTSPLASHVALSTRSRFRWLQDVKQLLWSRVADIQGVSVPEEGAKRVPTFYATIKINTVRGLLHTVIISCVGVVFGAIHCAGWNFVFRTSKERIIWRISSTLITVFPLVLIFYVLLVFRFVKRMRERKISRSRGITYRAVKGGVYVWYVFVRCLPVYLLARIILLLEALIELRNLPDGAFAQVQWSTFVPHI